MKKLLLNQLVKWEQAEKAVNSCDQAYLYYSELKRMLDIPSNHLGSLIEMCFLQYSYDTEGYPVFDRRKLLYFIRLRIRQITTRLVTLICEGEGQSTSFRLINI